MGGCLDVVHVIYDTIVFFAILPSMNAATASKLVECKEHHAMTFEWSSDACQNNYLVVKI